jgi:hypothetical protein
MAEVPRTFEYTIPIGGTALLSTITGWAERTWMGSIAMRADRGNADDIYWSDNLLSRGGFIGPGEAVTMNFEGQALIRNLRLIGTSGDVVYITIGLNSENFDYA